MTVTVMSLIGVISKAYSGLSAEGQGQIWTIATLIVGIIAIMVTIIFTSNNNSRKNGEAYGAIKTEIKNMRDRLNESDNHNREDHQIIFSGHERMNNNISANTQHLIALNGDVKEAKDTANSNSQWIRDHNGERH